MTFLFKIGAETNDKYCKIFNFQEDYFVEVK